MRKGIVGDWKNYSSLEAKQPFNRYGRNELISLGHEMNHNWVNDE